MLWLRLKRPTLPVQYGLSRPRVKTATSAAKKDLHRVLCGK